MPTDTRTALDPRRIIAHWKAEPADIRARRAIAWLVAELAAARADAERAVRERDRALAVALRMAERCWGQAELLARRAEGKG